MLKLLTLSISEIKLSADVAAMNKDKKFKTFII